MKILLTSNTSWSIYNFRHGLMKTFKNNGFSVSFCANYDEYAEKLKKEDFNYHEIKIDRKGKNFFKDLKLIFDFYKIYKKEKADLIIHYTIKPNIYGTIASKLIKIKNINVVTGMGHVFIKKGFLSFLVKQLYKLSFKFTEKTFFLNKSDFNFFIENKIIKKEKAVFIPGEGINTDYFSPQFCKKKEIEKFTFLYIGRMLKEKGIIELVNAFKLIKENYSSKLILVGKIDKGNPSCIFEEEIKKIENDDFIEYHKEIEDVRNFICESDCIVLPSYKEGLSRSLLEALSMEKLVITTKIPGCKETIEGILDDFLVQPKSIDDLREKMIKMIEMNYSKRVFLGKKLREKMIKEFDEKIIINKYLEEISNLGFIKY